MVLTAGTKVSVEEDAHNEFKMHTRLCLSEVPSKCSTSERGRIVRTMQPASKTISAFLNSSGGNVFIGINDEGAIKGLRMTKNMIDHFYLNLHHCLNNFTPSVPPELVKVCFEELIEDREDKDKNIALESDGDDFSDDGDIAVDRPLSEWFMSEHLIAGKKCDCNLLTLNQAKLYLIVIRVLSSSDGTIYQNEEGLAYRRRNGSNKMLTIDEVRQYYNTENMEDHAL